MTLEELTGSCGFAFHAPKAKASVRFFVKDGKATLANGTIAGSITNLHEELKNLVSWGIPFTQAVKAMTLNPAKQIGIDHITGSIEAGKKADLVILDDELNIVAVYH